MRPSLWPSRTCPQGRRGRKRVGRWVGWCWRTSAARWAPAVQCHSQRSLSCNPGGRWSSSMGGAVRHPACTVAACHCRFASWMEHGSCGSMYSITGQRLGFCTHMNQVGWMQYHEHGQFNTTQHKSLAIHATFELQFLLRLCQLNKMQFNIIPPHTKSSPTVSRKTQHKLQRWYLTHYSIGLHSIFMILPPSLDKNVQKHILLMMIYDCKENLSSGLYE